MLDVTAGAEHAHKSASTTDGAPLRRWSNRITPPACPAPQTPGASEEFLLGMHLQVPSLSAQQLSTLSLNLGVLDRVPNYFDDALDGERLRHPIELLGKLSNTALESLLLELRTLNIEYIGALHSENRAMSVDDTDISGFVRQGRSIISQEINRTIGYFHEVSRITEGLRHYYAVCVVPFDNNSRTKPLVRNLCRALTTAMQHLQTGMSVFEQRLRDAGPCNKILKLGGNEAQLATGPFAVSLSIGDGLTLDKPFVLPNIMRPSQLLKVTTIKQVRALTQFFTDYVQIIGKSFGDWAMLRGNIADLVLVIRDPSKREVRWLIESAVLSPSMLPYNFPEDVLSPEEEEKEQQELMLLRSLQCVSEGDENPLDASSSSLAASSMCMVG